MGKNYEELVEAYFRAEDFENMEKLIKFIPEVNYFTYVYINIEIYSNLNYFLNVK